jgi:IS30 family transposase
MMKRLPNGKKAIDTASAAIDLLFPYKNLVHSITADNGREFSLHEYYIPKKCNFDLFSDRQIYEFQKKLNRRPRKCIHFDKPVNLFCKMFT